MKMMNLLKKNFALLLAVVLCLSLTACGGLDDVVDDDWRNSDEVVGSGIITHTGEGSVDVLIIVSEYSAAFYWDQPEQVLYDSVSFPITVLDAKESFSEISLDDIDGDGESDVFVSFVHAPDDITQMVWIWDPEDGYVFREDLSILPMFDSDGEISEYTGLWEYVDENLWLRIYDDETWEFLNDQEDVIACGALWVGEDGITLYFEDTDDVLQLDRAGNGDLLDSENDGMLVPVDSIQSSVPYFSRNGLEINAVMDTGTYLLEDGVCSYANLGDDYSTGDCYWEVIKNYDQTHDGIREIQFDAICYIPWSSLGTFNQKYITSVNCELYDFYSGMWFTAATTYGDSTRGENYYVHTIDWNGQSETIEFAYSTDWQHNVGDWAEVLTKSYMVYLPEGYDGLIFAAEPKPDNFSDNEKLAQLDSISPEAAIMDIDLLDPYGRLFFSICD